MTELSYGAGNWLAVVRANTLIVLDERTGSQWAAELWDFLAGRPPVDEVLNKVTSGFGTELTGMPAFGIISFGKYPWAILRGEMTLTATVENTRMVVSGREVTTWNERSLPAAEVLELRLADDWAEPSLPLGEGVVRLSALVIGIAAQGIGGHAADDVAPANQPELELSRTLVSNELTESKIPANEPDVRERLNNTSSYDHLWDRTIARSVEGAAIRISGAPDEAAWLPPASDSAPDNPVAAPPSTAEPTTPGLGGAHPEQQNPGGQDHDGHTALRSDLPSPAPARARNEARDPARSTDSLTTGPMVLARLCPASHANPPTSARCSVCAQVMVGVARQVRCPVLGQMRISSGEVIDLDRSLVVGRQPSVSRVDGGGMPKLIQLGSPAGDISRSHVEVRLAGWEVILVDLKATNGTVLLRKGQLPRRLGQGEQAMLLNGDIAELGEDVSLRFEGIR